MGQKINPVGFRLAVNKNWSSRWYANTKNFAPMLAEDIKVRDFLKRKLAHASVMQFGDEDQEQAQAVPIASNRAWLQALLLRKVVQEIAMDDRRKTLRLHGATPSSVGAKASNR